MVPRTVALAPLAALACDAQYAQQSGPQHQQGSRFRHGWELRRCQTPVAHRKDVHLVVGRARPALRADVEVECPVAAGGGRVLRARPVGEVLEVAELGRFRGLAAAQVLVGERTELRVEKMPQFAARAAEPVRQGADRRCVRERLRPGRARAARRRRPVRSPPPGAPSGRPTCGCWPRARGRGPAACAGGSSLFVAASPSVRRASRPKRGCAAPTAAGCGRGRAPRRRRRDRR